MITQTEKRAAFASLHTPGRPLIIYNIWDPGSARAVAEAGAKAIATGSHPVANALGLEDGQQVPLDLVLANSGRIVEAVDLPVSIDFEAGYGETAAEVGRACKALWETGAIGINLEDQIIGGDAVRAVADQAERIAAAAASGLWINARTDIFIKARMAGKPVDDPALLDQALERARAYADAGANSFFAPALADAGLIARLCEASPLPVNIISLPNTPTNAEMARLGVARISYGPAPWRAAMAFVKEQAAAVFAG
ncbi:MAG TPA: isocitrate lyase/phosphoenolpyruvate mutase family protein [Allosphingosinicella sp.]|nr:isocitrate lyase/phosphoenolpyruvate mutase family protein [Allosphingosinicella sp.]